MPLLQDDYTKTEKMNGIIYNMSPSGSYFHGQINGNIYLNLRNQLKSSLCAVSMENLDLHLSDDEYWIISPKERSVEVHYLEDGQYKLVGSYILVEDEEDENYNADTVLTLRAMPSVKIVLKEIFENIE